ncbi:MAG TPA: hypothetical protein VFL17_23520 [Anaerolineae bacterium]|nr:hypothetical protein [Anaerolineae bacterium]
MATSPFTQPNTQTLVARLKVSTQWKVAAGAIALFALFAALFTIVQFATPALAGNDGYYHMKMGLLVREQGLKPPFVWLPLTILNREAFYDHHLLYHAYLSLFAFGDSGEALTLGGKIASVIMPALAFVAIWHLLRGQGVRWASLWALGLFAVSEAFLYRMSMPRAQSASLLLLVLGLHWMLGRRYRWLIPLGFVYVWLFDGFPLLLLLGGVYVVATVATERRVEWRAIAYPALGIGLGLIVNPYFPQNVAFILSHLAPKIGESATPVGNEWYPYETWTLVENSGFALAAFVLGALALGWRGKRIDRSALTAFLLSVAFGLMLFKSRRFVEYFPAFTLIFAALSIAPILEGWSTGLRRRWAPIALAAVLIVPLTITLSQAREAMTRSRPPDQYAAASAWLKENTPPGSMVFQTDWDDFTRLFFYNTSNLYTIGLDPTYMQLYDAGLYDEWVRITKGKADHPSDAIRSRFGGEVVMSDLNHGDFLERAADDPGLKEVYRDEYAVIFEVVD